MNIDSDAVRRLVERAVESALKLNWSAEYSRWATRWLTGTDRSAESAATAFDLVREWVGFGNETSTTWCCLNAAAAAEDLARGHHEQAATSANAAFRHYGVATDLGPGRPRFTEPGAN